MSMIFLNLTLTAAGKTLLSNAVANNQKLTVSLTALGNSQATPTEATTTIGTTFQTSLMSTQGVSLKKDRFEIQALFASSGGLSSGTIGVYIGSTLLGASKVTIAANTQWPLQLVLKAQSASSAALAQTSSSAAASLLGDIYKLSADNLKNYLSNGAIEASGVLYGSAAGNVGSDLCHFINIFYDSAEMASISAADHNGVIAYYAPTGVRMLSSNGAWEPQDGGQSTLLSVISAGRFYRSDLTKTLYYGTVGGLLRVKKSQ